MGEDETAALTPEARLLRQIIEGLSNVLIRCPGGAGASDDNDTTELQVNHIKSLSLSIYDQICITSYVGVLSLFVCAACVALACGRRAAVHVHPELRCCVGRRFLSIRVAFASSLRKFFVSAAVRCFYFFYDRI